METVRRLKCPRCSQIFAHSGGGSPACTNCGFGAKSPTAAQPAAAATTTLPLDPIPVALERQPSPSRLGPLGKKRSFAGSFFLGLITLGIYYLVYQYKVYEELNAHRGTRHATAAFWFGILLNPIFWTVYHAQELRNLNQSRHEVGLRDEISVTGFFAWMTWGALLLGLGPIIAFSKVNKSLNGYWDRVA